jgi:glycosyltransferase involved in cell wall biosynthesis
LGAAHAGLHEQSKVAGVSTAIRILWAVNVPLPEASGALGIPQSPYGGWLSAMTQRLSRVPGIELGVVMRSPVTQVRRVEVNNVCYYTLPQIGKGGMDARAEDCAYVLRDFNPDLLHANGSEMAYTLRLFEAWNGHTLLSLQGVLNGYEPYELGGLRMGHGSTAWRLRQVLPIWALTVNKRFRFLPRLRVEREIIGRARHVMGRTIWDRAQAWAVNPLATYHHGGETLRTPFQQVQWDAIHCNRHELFIGSCASPRKGAHVALAALRLLRSEYPGARLIIAGERPNARRSILKRIFGYPAYFQDRIREMDLQDCVEFTGLLNAEQMAARMARAHVFIMPSLIENSPNTLGEAMLLGMPCVSAFTGGTPGMAKMDAEALFYRSEDPIELAYQIKRLFDSSELCARLGNGARARALKNHDPKTNLQDLLQTYSAILGQEFSDAP